MRIVVLDGYTLNPGDLSWAPLEALGDCAVHDHTARHETLHRAQGAQIILTNKTVLDRPILEQLPQLKYVGVLATGYNVVDVAACGERKIVVTNVPRYGTSSVAQMVFALLLELAQHVGHHAQTVRDGRWSAGRDFCYWDFPLVELEGLTMGIVGLGRIGTTVGRLARAFGMKVLAHDALPQEPQEDVRLVSLEELLASSDVVTLHCPLTEQTRELIDARRLAMMKPTAFLINTSRGPVIQERDLAEALNAGRLGGAGLDVLAVEPPPADNPLLRARNCLIAPHIAWATRSARKRLLDIAVANVKAFLEGRPLNVVGG